MPRRRVTFEAQNSEPSAYKTLNGIFWMVLVILLLVILCIGCAAWKGIPVYIRG